MSDPAADADARTRGLAAGHSDPTAWFEQLYGLAGKGEAVVPWDRPEASALLQDWVAREAPRGAGRSAVVVGAGYGRDAELVAGLGHATTAFDVSPTAVAAATARHPDSAVRYVVADLLALPPEWLGAFDLVVESMTVQALPESLRPAATRAVASLLAPGGTLLVLAAAREDDQTVVGPPWPLTRAQVSAFADGGLTTVDVEHLRDESDPTVWRWRAEFTRG